jgi:hypothetical protein
MLVMRNKVHHHPFITHQSIHQQITRRLTYSGIRIDNGLYVVRSSQRPDYNRLITIL